MTINENVMETLAKGKIPLRPLPPRLVAVSSCVLDKMARFVFASIHFSSVFKKILDLALNALRVMGFSCMNMMASRFVFIEYRCRCFTGLASIPQNDDFKLVHPLNVRI